MTRILTRRSIARPGPCLALLALAAARPAAADPAPDWTDVPALLASATAPAAEALRACVARTPRPITIDAARARDGHTEVATPLPGLGGRGPTREERCLVAAIAKVALPPLPASIDRIELGYVIDAAGAAPPPADDATAAWRDPGAVVDGLIASSRAALVACAPRRRTVHVVLDRRGAATRVWLPAWQFHADTGDGTTPAAERPVRACLTRALRAWHPAPLPAAIGEVDAVFALDPRAAP